MATIPQQLIEIAERAVKSGAKTGKECAAFTRKHAPKLADDHISHLFLAFKMVKKAEQFGPAIKAAKAGASGTLAQLAKPYQGAKARPVGKAPALGAPYGATGKGAIDAQFARALGLVDEPMARSAPRRRRDPAPFIAPAVYDDFYKEVAKARK